MVRLDSKPLVHWEKLRCQVCDIHTYYMPYGHEKSCSILLGQNSKLMLSVSDLCYSKHRYLRKVSPKSPPPSSSTSESLARRKTDENQTVSLSPWMWRLAIYFWWLKVIQHIYMGHSKYCMTFSSGPSSIKSFEDRMLRALFANKVLMQWILL